MAVMQARRNINQQARPLLPTLLLCPATQVHLAIPDPRLSHDAQDDMHRALLVQEILIVIFESVPTVPSSHPTDVRVLHRTLIALACTCRAFTDVALDILWRDPPSLATLIQCMPVDVWSITANVTPERYISEGLRHRANLVSTEQSCCILRRHMFIRRRCTLCK